MSAHCKTPSRCSVCLATPFRVVEVRDGVTYVDGVAVRAADPGAVTQRTQNSMARGGRTRTGRGKR